MPPTPSVQARLAALEDAILAERARRLTLLKALLLWTQDVDTSDGFEWFVSYLKERIQDEGP